MNFKNKLLGYALAGIGLAGLATATGNMFPNIPKLAILIPSMIVTAIGVMIMIVTGGKGGPGKTKQVEKEVPIYKGKEIVGYRVEEN